MPVSFTVRAPRATAVWLCLFDAADRETRRAMARDGDDWRLDVADAGEGTRYGYRAEGEAPHDVSKLLVDPRATELDRRFGWDPRLSHPGVDTAALVPRAIVRAALPRAEAPRMFRAGGLIYELNVRGFTMLHPDVPAERRGTVAALAHPAVIAHLRRLRVSAVELMPIVAWIDERHLAALGLSNAWGYNPVVPMALDPGLVPGGMAELRATVAALRAAGIGTILDLVFNHSGESDLAGPTLSLRGLDDRAYARNPDGTLVNDTGTGNTLDFGQPAVRDLTLASLRHFVEQAGVDGFRFDLAPVLARAPGFDAAAPIFAGIADDPVLADRIMIAEPWDIGPGGYRLGAFPRDWLEWNRGVEGPSDDPAIRTERDRDVRALLATLFASRGTIMLAAGDEFGRTQHGNNNAYAQDNATSWLDWAARDVALEDHVADLAAIRAANPALADPAIRHDATWHRLDGRPMADADWADAPGFEMHLPAGATTLVVRIERGGTVRIEVR